MRHSRQTKNPNMIRQKVHIYDLKPSLKPILSILFIRKEGSLQLSV